ncbi:glycoside hydrolase family 2 TIM barrel-domain containing protein [Sphingomonas sp. 37zxx]|uniref:glycoside hydrolase family 2 TIM barrel-domain containing protein n=1 Tax=Sphingomonas sp. 37zxx TaxID=1550073 RepID=UPI00053BDB14|nr:glycoside hydrolase family 2 TIM barrel-domain containing protein [Sphingomonas sp. 37zxx]
MMQGRALLLALLALSAAPVAARDIPFDTDWRFQRAASDTATAPDAAAWQTVTLPHTTRIEPRVVNDQWQGIAFYEKSFDAPADWAGQTVLLRFEAAMNVAEVSVNGVAVASHDGGYLPFTIDLTPHLKAGAGNVVRVRLDNRDNPLTGPKPLKTLDFNTYGGLYRGVRLIVKPPVHLSDEMLEGKVAGGGLFVTYPEVSTERATIAIAADVRNGGAVPATATVRQQLFDGATMVAEVSAPLAVAPGTLARSEQQIVLADPKLWSPRSPSLYRLVTTIEGPGGGSDVTEQRIGIRRFSIDERGIAINGERRFLRGVNRHQEYPYVGYALSPQAEYRDAKAIKEAGFDYVRLSHYPHSPAFMRAADELGLVLIDAIPGWQYINPDPRFRAYTLQTCRDMIRRDRNHPSVMAWECSLNETQMPKALVEDYIGIAAQEYPGGQAYSAGWQNDGFDIFLQARQHRLQHFEPPGRAYIVSEYGDWEYYAQNAGFAQDSWGDLKAADRTSRQPLGAGEARLLQQATNVQEAHDDNLSTPAFADGYWAMFDYNRGYADDLETSGIMSIERLPKFAYSFFASQRDASEVSPLFKSGPMAKIASYWTSASSPDVRVFTNADEVELLLNGKSLGRKAPVRGRISGRIAHPPVHFHMGGFAPGRLEAVAYIGGREVARDTVTTPGAAAALCTAIDDAGVPVGANDLVFGRAQILDARGNRVPTANTEVTFAAGQGWEIVGPDRVAAEAGIASVLLRATGEARAGVAATATGLAANGACAGS